MSKYKYYKETPEAVWYKAIPKDWKSTKLRELFTERNTKVSDRDYEALSVGKMGVVPQLDTAVKTDNGDNRKLICEGDFAINSRSDRKGSSGISNYTGSASLIITVLKPYESLNRQYYHYLLRSNGFVEEFYRNGKGLVSDLWTTKWQEMKNIFIPVPPKSEQDKIARYLDWKISEIDRFIRLKKKQIKRLDDLKNLETDRLVLRGVKEHVFKKTDIIGLEEVPEEWEIIRNKNLFFERTEYSTTGKERLLSVSKHFGVKPSDELSENEQYATIKPAEDMTGYKIVVKNDLVMNIMRARNGSYGISNYDGIVSAAYCVYGIKRKCNTQYIHYLLRSKSIINTYEAYAYGICEHRRRLYADDFLRLYSILPDIDEQNEIVERIENLEKEFNWAISQISREIELVQELRTRIISDVVTGQIDVREVVIPEYDPDTIDMTDDIEDDEDLDEDPDDES